LKTHLKLTHLHFLLTFITSKLLAAAEWRSDGPNGGNSEDGVRS